MVNDDEHTRAQWRELQAAVQADDELQRLLAQLALSPDDGERDLREWLAKLASRANAPAELATYVSGGNVEQLVNIARADSVHLALHLGLPSPEPAGPRSRKRLRFNVPPQMPGFAGRAAELDALSQALSVTDQIVITQAITGLGGVGKSQLAARYLHDHGHEYDIVAWIRAEDGGIADLADLASELGQQVEGLAAVERASRALQWLNHADERWLVVLDNIASPAQLRGCCPHSGHGRVLITSRNQGMRQFGPLLAVDVFDHDTAASYLVRQTGRTDDLAGARRLATALGCLPLALSHAAAYCATGTTFEDYLDLLAELPAAALFDISPEAFYERTVASTWQASITAASDQAPLAGLVLAMAAYLAPEAIPKNLFEALVDATAAAERKRLSDALNALHRFSLIDVDDQNVTVHRLVQKTVRDERQTIEDRSAAHHALDSVNDAFPNNTSLVASWPRCEQLLPHALALAHTLSAFSDNGLRLIDLLDRASTYLYAAGGGQRAVAAAETAAALAAQLLGEEHRGTLTARHNLALSYRQAGRTAEAVELEERVLADSERLLGDEDHVTLIFRNQLAFCYSRAGRTAEAITLKERVVAESERVLGDEHPDTVSARSNLAVDYCYVGRTAEAITLSERVVADNDRLLGNEHPYTLLARGNLAGAYSRAGRAAEAITLYERVAADSERLLGDKHPTTLAARNNLAISRLRQDSPSAAA